MPQPRLYRGMRDFLPTQMIPREQVLDKIRSVFRRWGYVPIETPAIELLETLLGKYGDDADKLIYRIDHSDGLGLRYDLTVSLARLMATYGQDLPRPFRRYQLQPVWRAERAQKQKGRFREFIQCDVDIVGTDSPIADSEILAISAEILQDLGFEDFKILINHRMILRGLIHHAGLDERDEPTVLRILDKWDRIGRDEVFAELRKCDYSSGIIDKLFELIENDGGNWELLSRFESFGEDKIVAGVVNLRRILEHLSALGIGQDIIKFSPRMARGLDYYTGAIFETILPGLPSMGSLTGGGRYDNLIGMFLKNSEIAACGTTIGLDRILAAMEELDMVPKAHTFTKVLVAIFSDEYARNALSLAQKLRESGIATEVFAGSKKLSKQFAHADKWQIPYVLLIGEEEAAKDLCVLKEMKSGRQQTMTETEAVKYLLVTLDKI